MVLALAGFDPDLRLACNMENKFFPGNLIMIYKRSGSIQV
jgi:hypothetical protein